MQTGNIIIIAFISHANNYEFIISKSLSLAIDSLRHGLITSWLTSQ